MISNQVWQTALGQGAPARSSGYGNPQRSSIPVTVHQRGRTAFPTAGAAGVNSRGGGNGGAFIAAPIARQRRASLGAPISSSAVAASAPSSAQPPLSGMTRSEIFQADAAVLTGRLQQELSLLAVRVSEDSPQHLHSIRQIDDMAQEVRPPTCQV